uniref:DUF3456 domain-containing protein n=1 Tax=Parastrongyloides trichosuri TaxID=131310 RepID=A0A0N4Z0V7_PARTI
MKFLIITFLSILFISKIQGASEIKSTNYKCDLCNLIIREAFYQQIQARREDHNIQTRGFHSTEEKQIAFDQVQATKSEMYLEDLMSFVCGKSYFYALFKLPNTTDVYKFLPYEFFNGSFEFIKNTTIQFQNDCLEMVDENREELIAFFKKDHVFPVTEYCYLQKGICKKDEVLDFKAYTVKRNESDPNDKGEVTEIILEENEQAGPDKLEAIEKAQEDGDNIKIEKEETKEGNKGNYEGNIEKEEVKEGHIGDKLNEANVMKEEVVESKVDSKEEL